MPTRALEVERAPKEDFGLVGLGLSPIPSSELTEPMTFSPSSRASTYLNPVDRIFILLAQIEDVPGLDLVVDDVVPPAQAADDGRAALLLPHPEDLGQHAHVQAGQVLRYRHVLKRPRTALPSYTEWTMTSYVQLRSNVRRRLLQEANFV